MAAASSAILAISSLASGYSQSEAQKAQGDFQAKQFEINARFAELQGKDIKAQAEKDVANHAKQINQLIGSQRAALAAQGVDVGSGTALEIQQQTAEIGVQEMETIRSNAWRQAFGYYNQASQDRLSGQIARSSSRVSANATLISGALTGASYGADYAYSKSSSSTKVPLESGSRTTTINTYDPADHGRSMTIAERTA